MSNRALIIGALAHNISCVANVAHCNDTAVLSSALTSRHELVDVAHAGTAMRFLTAYYALMPAQEHILTGSPRMQQRPIAPLVDALRQLGASINYCNNEGYPPLRIKGTKLSGGAVSIRGDVSSQFISALLLVAPYMQEGLQLTLTGHILSQPYIDMTVKMMQQAGAHVSCLGNTITVAPQHYTPSRIDVENDYSAASYWYEIAALNAQPYRLENMPQESLQGDARVAHYFEQLGVESIYGNKGIDIIPRSTRQASPTVALDLANEPDLAQTIVMSCALQEKHFCITGLHNLRIKETDRIAALVSEAAKLGYIFSQPDEGTLAWSGERCEIKHPIVIDTHDDHRMAMAFAPATLRYDAITIDNPQVVNKSYPNFWKDLQQAGFNIYDMDRKEIMQ